MKIVDGPIKLEEIKVLAQALFGNFIKAVVDVEKNIIAVDAELHSDLAEELVKTGSHGENLWGINLYPEITGPDWIEFDSLINIKPLLNNRSRKVEDPKIQEKIISIVEQLVQK